jgi:nicotinate-nucleotide pyrophosphorylase (carboxylating)
MWIAPPLLDAIVDRTLSEDLASGDITTTSCVDASTRATATAVARSALTVCGGEVFAAVFRRIEPTITFERHVPDGTRVERDAQIWTVSGSARGLLMAERSALNLVQRMSGIATTTRTYLAALPAGATVRLTDTRKTTPGLRILERYAVRTGGAHNHRDDLGSGVMIKDNHIIAAGGIAEAIARARKNAPHPSRIEVEVANLDELAVALANRADIVMLDNFSLADLAKGAAEAHRHPGVLVEASGGITLETLAAVAATGVDCISVGALTHSAKAADIALDLAITQGT